jgi:hypothetical protein
MEKIAVKLTKKQRELVYNRMLFLTLDFDSTYADKDEKYEQKIARSVMNNIAKAEAKAI